MSEISPAAAKTETEKEWFRPFFDEQYVSLLSIQMPEEVTRRQVDFLVRTLRLPEGASILDVGCGFGRHAGALAQRGYRVTAVDLSPAMIAEARRRWNGMPNLTFQEADMRALPFRGEFDAAISMFTSFGYFSPEENRESLTQIVHAVKPSGQIVVDHRDLNDVVSGAVRRHWWRYGKVFSVLEDLRVDAKTGQCRNLWWITNRKTGEKSKRLFRAQFWTRPQWEQMLAEAGAPLRAAYADYDDTPHGQATGPRLILVADRRSV